MLSVHFQLQCSIDLTFTACNYYHDIYLLHLIRPIQIFIHSYLHTSICCLAIRLTVPGITIPNISTTIVTEEPYYETNFEKQHFNHGKSDSGLSDFFFMKVLCTTCSSFFLYSQQRITDFCKELSSHLVHLRNLPVQCKKYRDVVDDLKKRDVDDTANTADMS